MFSLVYTVLYTYMELLHLADLVVYREHTNITSQVEISMYRLVPNVVFHGWCFTSNFIHVA